MPSKVHLLIQEEHLEEFQQNLFVFLRSCVRRDHHNKSFPPPFFFFIHYARFCRSLRADTARGFQHKITWIAYTFDSKSTWWIGCLPGSGQTCLLPPLALQIKLTFFSSLSLSLLFLSSIFSIIACSRVVRDRSWHFVTWQSGKIMLRLHRPASTPTAKCPSGACERSHWKARLYKCSGHVCLLAYVHKCLTQTRLHLLSRNIIRMREAQCDCVQWPLSSPQVENAQH